MQGVIGRYREMVEEPRGGEPRTTALLPYISPVSPLHLPYISPTSALYLPGEPRTTALLGSGSGGDGGARRALTSVALGRC